LSRQKSGVAGEVGISIGAFHTVLMEDRNALSLGKFCAKTLD
jgi:hypothetical protein